MWFNKPEVQEKKNDFYFTEEWMDSWRNAIRSSELYKKRAKNWNAPVLLRFDPVPEVLKKKDALGFFLNLQYGDCREMRYATEDDTNLSDIVLTADPSTWIKLIEEKRDPTLMIMKGKLKLEKGSLVTLSGHAKAAKALLETAPASRNASAGESSSVEQKTTASSEKPTHFKTTRSGLDLDCYPMQLFQKAKKFGIWDPAEISFETDAMHWSQFTTDEKEILLHLTSLFMSGEEAVTRDLLPLIQTVSEEGRLEEEIYLTSFLWEEAKHTEFFSRFVDRVIDDTPDFERFHKIFYQQLFYDQLSTDLNHLKEDSSPLSQLKASGTYNVVIEGTLAETGYEAYYKMLNENNLMPGLQEGITRLKQDESRHIAFGIYFINRLLEQNPDLSGPFEEHLEELLNMATNVIHEIFEPYDELPFGLEKEWFLDYAIKQFQHRMHKLGLT